MGSSEPGSAPVDCSVGSIVWVRRRNGSWWPGKILGPDELSASHLMSPRSGTPVKLLGREDASVDWYNLEKSKRVKAFRCVEFDECIARAEASQGMPPKKREKYARREDAILHALELERQLLGKKYGRLGYSSNGDMSESLDDPRRELVTSSVFYEKGVANQLDPLASQVSGKHGSSAEHENNRHHLGMGKEGYKMNGDVDTSGALPRGRGLQEVGLVTAPLEQTLPYPNVSGGSLDGFAVENVAGCGPSSVVRGDAKNDSSLLRYDYKHRAHTHVLQNTAKLPHVQSNADSSTAVLRGEQDDVENQAKRTRFTFLPIESGHNLNEKRVNSSKMEIQASKPDQSSPADLDGEGTSDSAEDTETDSSEAESTESDTDEDMSALSDGAASIGLEPKYPERMGLYADYGSTSSEEVDELSLTDDTSDSYHDTHVAAGEGVSKWQLKRRRNDRSVRKRSRDGSDRRLSGGSLYGINSMEKGSSGRNRSDLNEKSLRTRMSAYGSKGFDGVHQESSTWQNLGTSDPTTTTTSMRGYWEEAEENFGHAYPGQRLTTDGKAMLIDVDLKVQASYRRPHVPLISLTSKLNGHAIVGHPIHIEAVESGSSESLLGAGYDEIYNEISDYSTTLAPVWRTARRTANTRVPRSHHPSSAVNGEESSSSMMVNTNLLQMGEFHQNRRGGGVGGGLGKAANAGGGVVYGGYKAGGSISMGKNTPPVMSSHQLLEKRLPRKQQQHPQQQQQARILSSLSCNQKIRTLSSIGGGGGSQQQQQQHGGKQSSSNDVKRGGGNSYVGGGGGGGGGLMMMIKPDRGSIPPPTAAATAVACIPVKLVFSRLHEELVGGRHQ